MQAVLESGVPQRDVYRCRHADGHYLWLESQGSPVRDEQGRIVGGVIASRDITDRKAAEDALRASEERLRVVVESSPNGIVTVNEDGTIVLVNQALAALFGYDRQELLGRSVDLLVPERFRARHPEHRREFFSHPAMRRLGENRFLMGLRKDGSEFPIEIGLAPLATSEGLHVTASIVHVTPRDSAPSPSQS